MSELSDLSTNSDEQESTMRCPHCDSVVSEDAVRCLMCGRPLPQAEELSSTETKSDPKAVRTKVEENLQKQPASVFESTMKERQSRSLLWLVLFMIGLTSICGFITLSTSNSEIILALVPTVTPFPPTATLTPTLTPLPTETSLPTETATPINTPVPTDTPKPPRFHSVALGETLFGLSLLYRVSPDSIATDNGLPSNSQIQVGQELSIPWPTATPPLESMVLDINGETVVVDVTDCEIVTIAEGDSTYGLSAQKGVPAEAIIAVNRLTEESIQLLHPGDTLCIPKVYYSDTLPPTVGPSPTITLTSFPMGPNLLYPINKQAIENPDGVISLQWVAVKDLAENEWYMIELLDLDVLDALPLRGFTRDNSFQIPSSWRPEVTEPHLMRWKISIVQVTGKRSDGEFIYNYGGRSSDEAFFTWLGAEPTPTPTATPIPTNTPEA